jgi:hypothetical protein
MKPDHALRQLQALMLASAVPHDERWQARFDDLARLVKDGQAKRRSYARPRLAQHLARTRTVNFL